MSAFARGAAGWLHVERVRLRRQEIEIRVRSLMKRFNVSEARARELAAQQDDKSFNRAPSGARR